MPMTIESVIAIYVRTMVAATRIAKTTKTGVTKGADMVNGGLRESTVRKNRVSVNDPILGMNLYSIHEIGILLNLSRSRVGYLTDRPGFPEPIAMLARGRVWKPADVLDWAEEHNRIVIVP